MYTFDLETFPNCFLFSGKFKGAPEIQTFEISPRRNDRDTLMQWLSYLGNAKVTMVGYNNLQFDYPLLHELLSNPYTFDAAKASHMAGQIIGQQAYGKLSPNSIRFQDRLLPQIDLMKINHFDNPNKRTSLKALQFAMRSESVEDLPIAIRDLTFEEMDILAAYNRHDVTETEKFLGHCEPAIKMRQELLDNGVLSGDVLNYSDVKIGIEYLVRKIGRSKCFISGSNPRQSLRREVIFKDIILPKIFYRTEEFNEVLEWFKAQRVYPGGEGTPRLETKLAGLQFHFGVGGVHASVENKKFVTSDTHVIKDIDVSGMYVAVAIANGFAPEHLGADFVTAYKQLQSDRAHHAKGSVMNLVLKLAGNGVFGNSNNKYSCFYDPKYTFSVTVNGQLQLIQLAEMLSLIPGIELIQGNTDGITALVPRNMEGLFKLWCDDWEMQTGLKLEKVDYAKMWIRDVNNYIALGVDGKIKLKGAYWYPKCAEDYHGGSGSNWNKDFSNMAAQKCIEACLINDWLPGSVVRLLTDPFDFMVRYKTPAGAKVYIGDQEQLKTVRYYISKAGQPMKKVAMPKGEIGDWKRKNSLTNEEFARIRAEIPKGAWDERIHTKNKSKYAAVTTSVESGRLVRQCNKASDFNWSDVDYSYYEEEIRKLVIGEHVQPQ